MKKIPVKNYYVVLLVSILVIFITLYIRSFYLSYLETIKNSSVFSDKSISQINADDLKYAVDETPEAILYIGYTGDVKIYNLEKRLYRELEKKNLLDKVIYWNVTNYKKVEYINILKTVFPNIADQIGSSPSIIYIKDGEGVEAINSDKKTISTSDLNDMLTKYVIK